MPSYYDDDSFLDDLDDSSYLNGEDDDSFFEEQGWNKTKYWHPEFDVELSANPLTWIGLVLVGILKVVSWVVNGIIIAPFNGIKWLIWRWVVHVDIASDSKKKTIIQLIIEMVAALSIGYFSGPLVTGTGSFGDVFYIINMVAFWLLVIDAMSVVVMCVLKNFSKV